VRSWTRLYWTGAKSTPTSTSRSVTVPPDQPAVERLADTMLQSFGQLALIVEHMSEWHAANPSGEAEPLPVVVRQLLTDALDPLAGEGDRSDVATAARVLSVATAMISEELVLVTMPAAAPCQSRRRGATARSRGQTH
jgi:hypothetical protein